ncbi:MAG: reverse transcriptase domain-containing protein [Microscillaceae bacterium]|nr:reverse transcriptase domain-containing protein [Microscillaceae bacterium]
MKNSDWFRIKHYPHIGYPLTSKDKKKMCSYVKNKNKISTHSFLPFIHKVIKKRRFRKSYDEVGNLLNDGKRVVLKPKERDIFYASHLDSCVFSYYGYLLGKKYEKSLEKKDLVEIVTAYRRVPIFENGKLVRNKCNIDFANDIFNFIRQNQDKELITLTFDIKNFFDSLDHEILKKAWCNVLNQSKLDDDHYNVYRNITKFSFVEEKDLFNLFKDKIIVKTKTGSIRKKKVSKLKYMYSQNAIAFCERKDIHIIRKKSLIRNNKYFESKLRNFGICQGSSISPILANIYMLEFDEFLNSELKKMAGLYRRYSDDMVIVCAKENKTNIISLVKDNLRDLAKLEIQDQKTQAFHFYKENDRLVCLQEFNEIINSNSKKRNFEYLGFSFDGEKAWLKTSTLAKFYRKMKLNVRRGKYYSKVINNDTRGQIFKRRIYKKFSYVGARRYFKYERVKGTTDQWRKSSYKYNWGNFITYAKLAINTLKNNGIRSQIKRHWKILNDQIKR